jgi:predicted Zn finger-like uncharacterized protein
MNVTCPECRSIYRIDPAKVPPAGVRARCSVCGGVMSVPGGVQATPPAAVPAAAPVAEMAGAGIGAGIGARVATPPGGAPEVPAWSPPPSPPAPQAAPASVGAIRSTPAKPIPPVPPGAEEAEEFEEAAAAPPVIPPHSMDAPVAPPPTLPERPAFGATAHPTPPRAAAAHAPPPAPPAAAAPPPPPPAPPTPPRPAEPAIAPRRPSNPYLANDPNQKARRLARALVSDIVAYHPQKREEALRTGALKQLFRDEIRKSYDEYVEQVGRAMAESTTHFQDALNDVLAGGKKVF